MMKCLSFGVSFFMFFPLVSMFRGSGTYASKGIEDTSIDSGLLWKRKKERAYEWLA
jgi:hypothetical protein